MAVHFNSMKARNHIGSLFSTVACAVALATSSLSAQQQPGSRAPSLPPALQAAVASGNSIAISRAITTLSGNDPQKSASLAVQVVAAAEQLLASNPTAAIQAARAAVSTVENMPVMSSAPTQTETVLTTAARIFIVPEAQRVVPEATALLATQAVQAAGNTNNPTLIASIASQAISVAEKMLAANPGAAVQLAAAAVQAVRTDAVMTGAPQNTLTVVTTAARIIVQPQAQQANPAVVATIATTVAQVASSPVVYAVSPSAAMTAMSNATTAATAPTVAAANPGAATSVSQSVSQAPQPSNVSVTPTPTTPVTPIDPSIVSRSY